MPSPNNPLGITYAQLIQMLKDWPENASTEYVDDLPEMVQLAELKLYKDLNLDIFDPTDASFVLTTGSKLVTKPVTLVQLRELRYAKIVSTSSSAADPVALCLAQATALNPTPLIFNGTLGAAPVAISPAAQIIVNEVLDSIGGISVVIAGNDYAGMPYQETVVTISNTQVTTAGRFGSVASVTVFNGAPGQTLKVGTAAVAASVLGEGDNIEHRSKAFCDAFNSDPSVVGPPRYYNELSQTQWEVVPAADQNYAIPMHYIARPQSIVTTGTSWLGDMVGDLLFYASLMMGERFVKADDRWDDISNDYTTGLQAARMELAESIRMGNYAPFKATATKAQ